MIGLQVVAVVFANTVAIATGYTSHAATRPSSSAMLRPLQQNGMQGQPYHDPSGRFSVMVPPGWTATSQAEGVVIVNGNVSATFSPFRGASSGRDVIAAMSNQYGSQWRNFQSVDQGEFTVAGRPASYGVFTGVNPRGTPSLLRIAGLSDNRDAYVVIMSAPQSEFNAASRTLQAIEQSFVIGNGAAPMSAAPTNAPPMTGGGALGIRPNGGGNPGGGGGGAPGDPTGVVGDPRGQNPGMTQNPGSTQNPGMMNSGRGNGAVLGVMTRDVEQADLPRIGIKERLGALITQVAPGSAAERARLAPGDLVLSADKQTIRQHLELQRIVANHRPGETLELIVMRQGQPVTLQVTLH